MAFCPKKEEPEFLKATDGISTSHPCSRSLQRNSPAFHVFEPSL